MTSKESPKLIRILVEPSWLSILIGITAGILLTAAILISYDFKSANLDNHLIHLQIIGKSASLTLPGQALPNSLNNNLENTWPLIIFWAILGLVIYFIVETFFKTASEVKEYGDELNYVHARRGIIIRNTFEYLFLRIIAAVAWLFFINFFFKRLVPYAISAAYTSAPILKSLTGLGYALEAVLLIVVSLHIHTVFLRLVLRRPRLFSKNYLL